MLLTFEISRPIQLRPGIFIGTIRGKKSFRIWWLWFSFGYTPLNEPELFKAIYDGEIIWKTK